MGFLDFSQSKTGRQGVIETMIGENASLKGELVSPGPIRIDGQIEGSVSSEEEVIIGEKAKVKGNTSGKIIVVAGEITGNVSARESVEIKKQGKVHGDISGNTLIVDQGASYKGKVTMGAAKSEKEEPVRQFSDAVKEIIGI
jgi:cytoskeletal protein CcmA (bactofilin family)